MIIDPNNPGAIPAQPGMETAQAGGGGEDLLAALLGGTNTLTAQDLLPALLLQGMLSNAQADQNNPNMAIQGYGRGMASVLGPAASAAQLPLLLQKEQYAGQDHVLKALTALSLMQSRGATARLANKRESVIDAQEGRAERRVQTAEDLAMEKKTHNRNMEEQGQERLGLETRRVDISEYKADLQAQGLLNEGLRLDLDRDRLQLDKMMKEADLKLKKQGLSVQERRTRIAQARVEATTNIIKMREQKMQLEMDKLRADIANAEAKDPALAQQMAFIRTLHPDERVAAIKKMGLDNTLAKKYGIDISPYKSSRLFWNSTRDELFMEDMPQKPQSPPQVQVPQPTPADTKTDQMIDRMLRGN